MMCGHCYHTICLQTYADTMKTDVAQLRCAVCKRCSADVQAVELTPLRGPTVPMSWTLATSPGQPDLDKDDEPVAEFVHQSVETVHEAIPMASAVQAVTQEVKEAIPMASAAQAVTQEVNDSAAEPVSDMGAAGSDGAPFYKLRSCVTLAVLQLLFKLSYPAAVGLYERPCRFCFMFIELIRFFCKLLEVLVNHGRSSRSQLSTAPRAAAKSTR